MQRQTTRQTKIASRLFLAFAALTLAGCGNHNQADTSGGSGTKTPAQVQQDATKQNNQPNAAAPPTAGH